MEEADKLEKVAFEIAKLIQEASKDKASWTARYERAETRRQKTFAYNGVTVTEQRIRDYKQCLYIVQQYLPK